MKKEGQGSSGVKKNLVSHDTWVWMSLMDNGLDINLSRIQFNKLVNGQKKTLYINSLGKASDKWGL